MLCRPTGRWVEIQDVIFSVFPNIGHDNDNCGSFYFLFVLCFLIPEIHTEISVQLSTYCLPPAIHLTAFEPFVVIIPRVSPLFSPFVLPVKQNISGSILLTGIHRGLIAK